jgi:hypothetical protein
MKTLLCTLLLAPSALAFTTTHLVIVESTPLYDWQHPFDDDYILTNLGYWTELEATTPYPLSWRTEPHQSYYLVTLEDGTEGLVASWDAGSALVTVKDNAAVYHQIIKFNEVIDNLEKGEFVADTNTRVPGINNKVSIFTKDRLSGWVDSDAVEPAYVFPETPPIKYDRPKGESPQNTGKEK